METPHEAAKRTHAYLDTAPTEEGPAMEAHAWGLLKMLTPDVCPCGSRVFHAKHLNKWFDEFCRAIGAA